MVSTRLKMGDHLIDLDSELLTYRGEPVHLKPQVFSVLAYLVQNAGKLVTRLELIEHVWGPCEVDYDSNLNTIMLQIRRALRDGADSPRYIETVPRKGFRVVATVKQIDPKVVARHPKTPVRWMAIAATMVVALAVSAQLVPDSTRASGISSESQALYARGKVELRKGNFKSANDLLEQALAGSPEFAPAMACLALAQIGLHQGSEEGISSARQHIKRALEINSDDPTALTVAAQIAMTHDRDLEQARKLLDRALAKDSADPHAFMLSAWNYSATGEHDQAGHAIREALLRDPLSPQLNLNAAKIYEAAGDIENAQRFSQLAQDLTSGT